MLVGASLGFLSGAGGGDLSSVVSSTCCDLDSTISSSYTSGTTWKNMVAAPADGSSQTAYDFYLGSDSGAGGSTDPVFTGSAGTTAAYWAVNGSQFFNLKAVSNPSLFKNMHKTSGTPTPFWFVVAGKTPGSLSSGSLWGTTTTSGDNGIECRKAAGSPRVSQYNGAAGNTVTDSGAMSTSTDTIIIVSVDCSLTTSNVRFWTNTRTKTQQDKTFGSTSTDATKLMSLASTGNGNPLETGWRLRTFAAGNALIDDSTAATIINTLNARHGLTYV